jgi:hypothetical protein
MSTRESMNITLTLKEYGNQKPFIMLEPSGEKLSFLADNSYISLDFYDDVTFEEAKEILKFIDGRIAKIKISDLDY